MASPATSAAGLRAGGTAEAAVATSEPATSASGSPNLSVVLAPVSDPDDYERADTGDSEPQDSSAWRKEVAASLNRYQARRKPRPPRYPSLRLRFEDEASDRTADGGVADSHFRAQMSGTSSRHALALDSIAESAVAQAESQVQASFVEPATGQSIANPDAGDASQRTAVVPAQTTAHTTAKIIEFPRSSSVPPAPLDELAEPVIDRPRILEAPALAPPAPALGGITIEGTERQVVEKRRGIDIPLQSAPLIRRMFAAALDAVVVAAAGVLFGFVFWKVAAVRPANFQIWGFALGLAGLFWASCQYLLIVYSGTTPGLLLARLELTRFDGAPVNRRLRRWRVLASFLSAVSLGMGYLWVFLDEDALCWHDRITHTYLAPKRHQTAT